jgi:hypothetical protein
MRPDAGRPAGMYHDVRDDYDDEFAQAQSPTEIVRRRLFVPGVAFVAIGVLGILGSLAGALLIVVEFSRSDRLALLLLVALMWIAASLMLFVMLGGLCLLRVRRYRVALGAAYIVTGLALAGAYAIFFFPFGIWALVRLYQPDVRAAFDRPDSMDV